MKLNKEGMAYVVIFSFICCGIFVAGLAAANAATKPLVAANRAFSAQGAALKALGIPFASKEEAAALYAQTLKPVKDSPSPAFYADVGGKRVYLVEETGAGLWGAISILVAAEAGAERLVGLEILAQNETPGLGGRIDEAWFKEQFRGELIREGRVRISLGAEAGAGSGSPGEDGPPQDDGLVDGISGASRTSAAFELILTKAIRRLAAMGGEGE